MVKELTQLTASEYAEIWFAYMSASLTTAVLKYFIEIAEDEDTLSVIEDGLHLSQNHTEKLTDFFYQEEKPLPVAFTDKEVNPHAPRLYSDNFLLQFVHQIGVLSMSAFTTSIYHSTRDDIYTFFSEGFREFNLLHQKASKILIDKGLYVQPPYVPTPNDVSFVQKQSFLSGWFGNKRPLTTLEIASLYSNLERNQIGIATLTGFSQVANSQEVKDHIKRGVEIAKKHVNIFRSVLEDDNVPAPMGSDAMVTDETKTAPFSDKLMLSLVSGLVTAGIGFYGNSISAGTRKDLVTHYMRLIGEIELYSEDGANILINNQWLEEPPRMVDRDELTK